MYSYKKKWYTFGIIESIYYSKSVGYIIDFTDKKSRLFSKYNLEDFVYSADKKAFSDALAIIDSQDKTYVIYDDYSF